MVGIACYLDEFQRPEKKCLLHPDSGKDSGLVFSASPSNFIFERNPTTDILYTGDWRKVGRLSRAV